MTRISLLIVTFLLLMPPFFFGQPCIAAETAAAASIYSVAVKLIDQDGREFLLSGLAGKQVVLAMAYTSCKSACPLTMQRLIKLERELAGRGKKAEFLVVTLDPEHDRPQQLKRYQLGYNVNKSNWRFATGDAAEIRKLSLLIGVSYKSAGENGEIMHSNKIILLNRSGAPAAEIEGLAGDPAALIEQAE